MKRTWMALSAAGALSLGSGILGCASPRPPNQLLDARTAYQHATSVPGASMAASDLFEARQSLDAAEQAYMKEGSSNKTKNLAYIAHRKAVAATAKAETLEAIEEKRVALADFQRFKDMHALAMRMELERAKGALSAAQRQAEAQRQARAASEAKTQDALNRIEGLRSAESDRGLVLTLSGGLLFPTGKSQLTPAGKKKLAELTTSLKDDKRNIVVVGHTDTKGSDEANMNLSKTRADAVREYLVSQGIDESRIRSEGKGETQPIADNATPEGRATNRRVEIILEKSPEAPLRRPDEQLPESGMPPMGKSPEPRGGKPPETGMPMSKPADAPQDTPPSSLRPPTN